MGEKTCFSPTVPKSSTHPERRCECDIDSGEFSCEEAWPACEDVTGTLPTCPETVPLNAFQPDEACEKYLECFYNFPSAEQSTCCGGSVPAQHAKCSCTPNGKFSCGLADEPCAEVNCDADVMTTLVPTTSPTASPTITPPRPTREPTETQLLPPSGTQPAAIPDDTDQIPKTMICPPNDPFGSSLVCGTSLTCPYGTESCCGRESPSLICNCDEDTTFGCFNTDACFLPQCQESCPDVAPVDGATCNSTDFSGWTEFDAEGNLVEGSCLFDENSCSCPNSPGIGLGCRCISDVWECSTLQCDVCADSVAEDPANMDLSSMGPTLLAVDSTECPDEPPSTGETCSSELEFATPCTYGDDVDCCGTMAAGLACSCDGETWTCAAPSCPSPCPTEPICPPDDAIITSCNANFDLSCDFGVQMCMDDPCGPNPEMVPSGPEFSCNCFDGEWGCGGTGCGSFFCGAREAESCGGLFRTPCERGLTCVDDPTDACSPANGGVDCTGMCVNNTCPQGPLVEYKGKSKSCDLIVDSTCDEGLEWFYEQRCGCGCKLPTLKECPPEGVPPPGTPCDFLGEECQYEEKCCPDGVCINQTFATCEFPGMISPIGKQDLLCASDLPIGEDFPFDINGTSCTVGTTAGDGCCGQPAYNCTCENDTYNCISLFTGIDCLCVEEQIGPAPPELVCPGPDPPRDGDICTDPGFFVPCNYGEVDCCGTFVYETSCFCDKETETWSCSDPPMCPSPCPDEAVCPPEDAVVSSCSEKAVGLECEVGELMCFDDICSDNPQMIPNGPISTCFCEEGGFWGCRSLPCGLQLCPSKTGESCGPTDVPCELGLECVIDPNCPDCLSGTCQEIPSLSPPIIPNCPAGPDPPTGACTQDFDFITPCYYDQADCCGTTIAGTSCSCEGGTWECGGVLESCPSPCPPDPQCPPQDAVVIKCTGDLSCDYGELQCLDDPCGERPALVSMGPATTCLCDEGIWGCTGAPGCDLFECQPDSGRLL
mmetsp:Transcript_20583/g.30536  ORF Transcript_20583/g.30536 Transcript_20583/m.30536 type:complete len:996 (-) Transcript_20583:292-3279(-)